MIKSYLDHGGIRNIKVENGDESYFETIISGVMFTVLIGIVWFGISLMSV